MDYIRPTPRNPIYGLLADQLEKLYSPTQTQQMQGLMKFLMVPEVSKTMNLLAYDPSGRSLFTGAGGLGGTTKPRPEVAEAALAVAPIMPMAGRAARGTARMVGQEMADRVTTGRSMLPSLLAEPKSAMFAVEPNAPRINVNKGIYKDELTMEEMLKVKDIPTVDRVRQSIDLVGEKEFENLVNAKFKKYKPTNQDQEAMLVESVTLQILGKAQRSPYPQQAAIQAAQKNAEKMGQSVEAYPRSLQQGYDYGWYHGSTGDIKSFNPSLLGEATGAASAKKGFFFARDPQNPPESLLKKSTDESSIEMLRKMGMSDDEITKLNTVSMAGQGAETASGYAQIGGSREYREATRKAKSAEKRGDWDEYEKQMQIAEDSEINRMNYAQSMVAKYGDARDTMTEKVNQTFYSLQHPQAQAELLDKKYKELMPYGWYNIYDNKQFNNLKKEIVNLVGEKDAAKAIKTIDDFQSIKNERAVLEKTQEGGNVMPVALRYKNPMVYDFEGKAYREQTYSDLIDQALSGGHDALILKNTFDPGGGPAKLVDVGVVFDPSQIRSTNAAFDPMRRNESDILAGLLPASLLADPETRRKLDEELSLLYTK
jgi:hypothetical protein